MNLLVIDLEMCEVDKNLFSKAGIYLDHEIIQIGACILNEKNKITEEYSAYVKPQYGTITPFISELTGIIDMDVEKAPELAKALRKFCEWLKDKDVIPCSWSDTDLIQLTLEMEQKKIKNDRIDTLTENWVDIQKSYDSLKGSNRSTALEKAMKAENVRPEGRAHDGCADAHNTALLIAELRKQGNELSLEPVNQNVEYTDTSVDGEETAFGSIFANLFG